MFVERQIEFGPPGLNSDRRAEFSLPRCPLLQPLSARCVTGPAVHSGDCDSRQFAAVTAEWKQLEPPPALPPSTPVLTFRKGCSDQSPSHPILRLDCG